MAKDKVETTPAVQPFILEGTTSADKAARFARGEETEDDRTSHEQRRYLLNSAQIVTIDDERMSEREKGITRVFMSRGDTMFVSADFDTLREVFRENGYNVYSLGDMARKSKAPGP